MNPLLLNHLIGFSLIAAVLPSIAALVYFSRPKNLLNQIFALYSLAIAWWAFFTIFMIFSPSPKWGLFWDRVCLTGVVFIPSTLFHFISAYTRDEARLKWIVRTNYFISLFFLTVLWLTDFFVAGVQPKFGMEYFTIPGYLYIFYVSFFVLTVIIAMYYLYHFARKATHLKIRKQASLLFWFSVIGYTGGSCNYLLVYDINLPGVAETSNYGVLILSISIAYIIFRYRFLDIEVIIKRTLVYFGIVAVAVGGVSLPIQLLVGRFIEIPSFWLIISSVVTTVLIYRPLDRYLTNLTDRFLFQKKYDYKKLLKDAAAGISQIKSLGQLLSLVVHFITMKVRVKNAAVLVHDKENDYFKLAYMRGYSKGRGKDSSWLREGHIFGQDDLLVDYLNRERLPLDIERVKEWAEAKNQKAKKQRSNHAYDFEAIKTRMNGLQAVCCVPSFLGNRLLGILILGEKKSGDFYTDEDLAVLYTIAQESAIAIENARLYDEAIEKAKELELINQELNAAQTKMLCALNETETANKRLKETQAELIEAKKRALLAGISSAVGHEIRNPLTPMMGNLYYILKSLDDANHFYQTLAPKLSETEQQQFLGIINALNRRFSGVQRGSDRIKGVVNTLINLVKERSEQKAEVGLKLVIASALEEVRFQTYWDSLTIPKMTVDIPADLPFIKGITQDLQGVFVNFIINSLHAMEKTLDKQITIKAAVDPDHPKMIRIDFTDNGCGIPMELREKIFEHGFTTKGEKGTGIGLFYCKDNIERVHGGTISIRSEAGIGTCFTLKLPVYEGPEESGGGQVRYGNTAHH